MGEQVVMIVMRLGIEFATYSTKLSKVVRSRVNGRKATLEHREEIGTRDKL